MRTLFAIALASLTASPALAASGPFFSLDNTNFIVLLAFILFIAILFYFKVPGKIAEMLDKRAAGIKSDLDEARALREEAQTLLASYERKQQEVQTQANRIVETAKSEAAAAAEQAREDLQRSIARRIAAAQDQIASAEAAAIKDVRDCAIAIAVAAAKEVMAKQMTAAQGNKLIDESIKQVDAKLH